MGSVCWNKCYIPWIKAIRSWFFLKKFKININKIVLFPLQWFYLKSSLSALSAAKFLMSTAVQCSLHLFCLKSVHTAIPLMWFLRKPHFKTVSLASCGGEGLSGRIHPVHWDHAGVTTALTGTGWTGCLALRGAAPPNLSQVQFKPYQDPAGSDS